MVTARVLEEGGESCLLWVNSSDLQFSNMETLKGSSNLDRFVRVSSMLVESSNRRTGGRETDTVLSLVGLPEIAPVGSGFVVDIPLSSNLVLDRLALKPVILCILSSTKNTDMVVRTFHVTAFSKFHFLRWKTMGKNSMLTFLGENENRKGRPKNCLLLIFKRTMRTCAIL